MKMDPKAVRKEFNRLAQKGGDAVIYNQAHWHASGLDNTYGALPAGHMAVAVFGGKVQENTQAMHISNITETKDKITVEVWTNILGGPPSRPGHYSYPQDVKFIPETDKPIEFEYKGMVQPAHRQNPPKVKP